MTTTITVEKTSAPADEGFYLRNGEFFKVMWNRAGTRRYARILDLVEVSGVIKPHWIWTEVCKGMVYKLTETERVTPAQAKAFGDMYHHCFKCGRELTVPQSIEDGIGPKCKAQLGW